MLFLVLGYTQNHGVQVSPIFKRGNKDIADNYRGITLINIFSKIYSHVLNNRLLK